MVEPFEPMHRLYGHENLLIGMALDPDWVRDMVGTYITLTIGHPEVLFAEEGAPNGMLCCEDLGLKQKPFMSPSMYRATLHDGHRRLFDFGHSWGCIALWGGVDGRLLSGGDLPALDEEMDRKIVPVVTEGGGYILGCPGSGSPDIDYATIRRFVERGRTLGRVTSGE